jgi:chromosome segregation ATPase
MQEVLKQLFSLNSRALSGADLDHIERPGVGETPAFPSIFDRNLTYYRDGLRWTFSSGRVCVDGMDVNKLVNDNPENVGFFMGIAEGLNDYRKKILKSRREQDQFAKFEATIDALLNKLLGKLKKFYDQKMSGMSWTMQNGQLILNGINIRSFLALYRIRKTDKARKFLKGLRSRLEALLENRRESPDYERIRDAITDLHREINAELMADEAADTAQRLLPRAAHAY